MFIGHKIESHDLDSLPVVSVSFDGSLKHSEPIDIWGNSAYWNNFLCFAVTVTYPGNLVELGAIKAKKTFSSLVPNRFIGVVKYMPKTNTTDVTHVFKVANQFFAEDDYHRASLFYSLMSCRAKQKQIG